MLPSKPLDILATKNWRQHMSHQLITQYTHSVLTGRLPAMQSAFPEVQDEVFAELQAAGLAPTSKLWPSCTLPS